MDSPNPASSGGALSALESALAGAVPPVEEAAQASLARLLALLLEWREAGITGFASSEALVRGYFEEALALRAFLPPRGPYLDVGSGGGTPALPLAVVSGASEWTLLEPRRTAVGFLELAIENLGITDRVRVVRCRLKNFLSQPEEWNRMRKATAVTLRAVRLRKQEWKGLAQALRPEARVIWPTSQAARERADLPSGLYEERSVPVERGIVWIGCPRRTQ